MWLNINAILRQLVEGKNQYLGDRKRVCNIDSCVTSFSSWCFELFESLIRKWMLFTNDFYVGGISFFEYFEKKLKFFSRKSSRSNGNRVLLRYTYTSNLTFSIKNIDRSQYFLL